MRALPGLGTAGLSASGGILEPRLYAAEDLWVHYVCGNIRDYIFEFAAEEDEP